MIPDPRELVCSECGVPILRHGRPCTQRSKRPALVVPRVVYEQEFRNVK